MAGTWYKRMLMIRQCMVTCLVSNAWAADNLYMRFMITRPTL